MEKGSSSSSSSGGGSASDSLSGLKFGKKIYFEGVGSGPPSPAKKGRTGVVHGGQPPRCQVEGCKVDLSDAKAYYCRHKVCGMHSKSPKVTVAGIEQRFCQQCSRFHELCEFDQGKRSCRRRLAGHNERRRKPPPGPLLSSRYGYGTLSPSTLDNQSLTGGFVMDFSAYSAVAGRDDSRAFGNQANNNITGKYHQLPWQLSSSQNQHPPPHLHGYAQECFNGASDSNSALSLLSSHPTTLGVNTFLATATNGSASSVQPPQFSSWGFKGNQGNSNLEMHADMGLAQISQEGQYGGALELGQPSHGQYHELEPSVQHMHWSL